MAFVCNVLIIVWLSSVQATPHNYTSLTVNVPVLSNETISVDPTILTLCAIVVKIPYWFNRLAASSFAKVKYTGNAGGKAQLSRLVAHIKLL